MNTCSKTDSRSTLSSGKYGTMSRFLNVFEDLRFGCTRITEKENIDITTNGMFAIDVFRNASEERQCNCCLDVFVAIDTGSNRLVDSLGDGGFSTERFDFTFVLFTQSEAFHL